MARRPRLQYRGAIYHVMSRGNRKAPIFDDDKDRQRFLSIVGRTSERYEVRCLAFCLMGNHYHMVLETPRGNLSAAMRQINGIYTQYLNRRHGRTGHVFEGRFMSLVVENDSYLRTVIRYVVLNPVRARLVFDASAWAWSSYRPSAGLASVPAFMNLDWLDWAFAAGTRHESQVLYRAFIESPEDTDEIDATALVLGSPGFEAGVRAHIGATLHQRPLPRAYRALARPTLAELFSGIGFTRRERDRAIRRGHVVYGYQLCAIAQYLGLHPNSVSKVMRQLREQISELRRPTNS